MKALVAFPSVLAQMDKNIQWTTDLGNAYYNQPQDVMNAVQAMRSRAQAAGNLHDTQQQTVSEDDGNIAIAPANPDVVYVPAYNPWIVYGAPVAVFPGYYYGPPAGVYFGAGLAIGFGVGIAIGYWSHWGWGWHGWGCNWHGRTVIYNHTTYVTRSTTVINRGWNRAGGPHGYPPGARGAYYRGDYNHGNYHPQGNYRNGAVNHGTQPGYHGHAQSYHGGPQGHAPQSHSNGGGHYTGGHEGGGHAAGHPR